MGGGLNWKDERRVGNGGDGEGWGAGEMELVRGSTSFRPHGQIFSIAPPIGHLKFHPHL